MSNKAFIQSFAAIVLWGVLAYLGVRLAHVPPFLLVGTALVIGAACSAHKMAQWRVPFTTLLLGIYGLFGFHFCLFVALRHAPPVEANLINYLWPLLIVVLSPLFLPSYSLTPRHIAAALLGFAGAALIVTGGHLAFDIAYLPGYGLAAASAFIWSSYSLMTKRIRPFPNAALGLFCLCAGLASLLMHFLLEERYVFTAADVPPLLLLGIGPMGAAFFLWDAALKNGDPRIIGSLAYLAPLLSTLVLVVSGSGPFTAIAGIAALLILGGAVLGSMPASAAPPSPSLPHETGKG